MPRSGALIALCVVVAFATLVVAQTSNTTTTAASDDPYKIKAYQAKVDETEKANDIAQTTAQRYAAHKIFIRRRISNLVSIAGRLQNKLEKAPATERPKLASTLGRVKQRIIALRSHFSKFKQLEMKAEVAAKEAFDVLHNYLALVKNATKAQRRENWLSRSGAIAKVNENVSPIDPKPDHPEQIHLQLAGQRRFPNQKMVVNWVTGVPPAGYKHESVVQWSLSRHAMSIGSRISLGHSHTFTDGGVERRNISIHSGLIDGLDPEIRYYFRVGVRLIPTTNTTTASNATTHKLNFSVNQWQYSNVFHFQTLPKLTRAKIQRRSFAQKDVASTQSQIRHSARSVKDQATALTDSIEEMYNGAFQKLSAGNKELDVRLARKRARILREMKRDQREIDEVMGLIPRGSFLEEEEDLDVEPQQAEEEPQLSVEEEAERELSMLQISEEEEDDGADTESEGSDENAEGSEETENTETESTEASTSDENTEDTSDNAVPKLSINEAVEVRREAVLSQEEALKQPPKGYDRQTEFPTVFRGPPNQYRAMPESLKQKLKLKKTMLKKLKQLKKDLAKSDQEEKERLQRLYRKLKRSYKTLFKKGPKPPQWQARPLSGQPFTARTPISTTKAAIDVQNSKFGPKTASKHRFGAAQVPVPPAIPRLATDPPKPIEIAVYGDMGVQLNPSIKKLYAEIHARELDMVIHTGDYAYDMHDDSGRLGDTFMNMIEPIAAYVPYMTCTGNHEYPYNYSHYTERFWGLSDYADSGNNHYYSFDVGTVHFVAFNSDAYLHPQLSDLVKRQYEWLEADLARANRRRALTPFIVLFAHHPMYCSNTQDINECTTQAFLFRRGLNGSLYSLEDLLVKHNVDIYISAHEHSYERTYPVFNGKIDTQGQISPSVYRNARFPVHIIAGAAGDIELLDLFDEVWYGPWSVTRSSSYGYGHLTVHNHTHLQWRQFLDEGRGGVDEFWVVKDSTWPGMDQSVLTPTHPFSPQTRTCDHYCYATCMGRLKKSNPEQINVRRITECVPQCNCQPEARKGMIDVLGQDIVSRRAKIVVK